ncbi:hypothetical protein ACI2I2_16640 [Scandinavium sp. NPDC088450]|uniref:hypothetical protein n=1 Tax=Scandinavium sp. NPDC088450 TaxID=3364514 RepID=UPI00384AE566
MNVKEGHDSNAESVNAAMNLLNDLQKKIADVQCDDLPAIAQKLTRLQDRVLAKNSAQANLVEEEVFSLAVDIEANLYERLSVLDESRHTLSAMAEELHTLSSTLHANMRAMSDKC